jgi:hydrogenase maturation protease
MNTDLLVIGYGNELRSDDGVGPRVARAVAEWRLPGVEAIAVHQLTLELCARMCCNHRDTEAQRRRIGYALRL